MTDEWSEQEGKVLVHLCESNRGNMIILYHHDIEFLNKFINILERANTIIGPNESAGIPAVGLYCDAGEMSCEIEENAEHPVT